MKSAPARTLAEVGTGFERRLLAAARGDGIPAAARDRLARVLSVPLPASPVTPAARVKWAGVSSRAARWSVVGVVGAAAAAMGAQQWLGETAPTGSAPARIEGSALVAAAPVAAAPVPPPPAASSVREAALPPREIRPPAPSTKASAVGPASSSVAPRRASPAPSADDSGVERGLRAELRAVEAIQKALRAGRADDAERRLDDYSRRFPRGELAIEAELLRIDLDVARGDHVRARERAQALIARPAAGRYRERLEALMQRD
jgi:hypothetical protein